MIKIGNAGKTMNHYPYRAFGLNIVSAIPLPELPSASGIPAVRIEVGATPSGIAGAPVSTGHFQAAPGQLLLWVPKVGNYWIENGNQIVVEPAPASDPKAVRLFLLGSALGALLMQRGILPIHGSAVVKGKLCCIITGARGAGKSTLAAALRRQGYRLLTDDLAAVGFDATGRPLVYPAYPQQKLWRDSLAATGNAGAAGGRIYGRVDKYAIPVVQSFCDTPQRLGAIYELRVASDGGVNFVALRGLDKLTLIMKNIYRPGFAGGLGLREALFRQAAGLAGHSAVARITRPAKGFTMADQVALVEEDLPKRSVFGNGTTTVDSA